MQHLRDVVDARRVDRSHHGGFVDIAHQEILRFTTPECHDRATHHGVGLDADLPQGGNRVLCWLRLQFTAGTDVGHQGDVQKEDVLPADIVAHLSAASRNGKDSMSPTVPPISWMTTSMSGHPWPSSIL